MNKDLKSLQTIVNENPDDRVRQKDLVEAAKGIHKQSQNKNVSDVFIQIHVPQYVVNICTGQGEGGNLL